MAKTLSRQQDVAKDRLMVVFSDSDTKNEIELLSSIRGISMNALVEGACKDMLQNLSEKEQKALRVLVEARKEFGSR